LKALGAFGESSAVVFPEGFGTVAEQRLALLRKAAESAAGSAVRVSKGLDLSSAYRGIGMLSPVVAVDGIPAGGLEAFAKQLCILSGERQALVHPAGSGGLRWMEREEDSAMAQPPEEVQVSEIPEATAKESRRCEEWARHAGTVVVARVQVEDWFAPEGVFRWAWLKTGKEHGAAGMEFALRWARKDGTGQFVERMLVVTGASLSVVEELVASVPGATVREIQLAAEGKGDGRWLEEVFGEGPAGESGGEWVLAEAGCVEPPRPSVSGRHDRYFPIRSRGEEGTRAPQDGAET
jgi:hypothetical protein